MRPMDVSWLEMIATPAALVDLDRVDANLQRVARYTQQHGLRWRPHTKTHKTPEFARRQLEAGAHGVTVATVREAEVMAEVCDDVLLAYPAVGEERLGRLMNLPSRVRLTVALDSVEALHHLGRHARTAQRTVGVLVELEMGMRRVGVATPEDALSIARAAASTPGIEYRGVTFYAGHLRAPGGALGSEMRAQSERLALFVDTLSREGLRPDIVSGGSTPTLWRSHEVTGLTEIRPGINIFNDRNSVSAGACAWDACAYSVLSTVVSTSVPGQAVIDAGSKALAKEEGFDPSGGYGALLDRPEVRVQGLSEEHGLLDLSRTDWRPRVGELVRVVPNHVCASVNLHERLYLVRQGHYVAAHAITARGW
ncbi:low-specificity D-threonine aldolase [Myxococcus hansupus]|uniref:Low-specificity D-threonine aldolase n=1 Tax=Pseudomyxococcus hansupus TaxID=1297742 RepID=A0A0H4WVX5_9BACT|nr:D-TA family PLP-dependent enzyme [Myxococcus hansupus]AKQ66974.1 low-specificity D-threonine aldolase [Myxococcus hansupus]